MSYEEEARNRGEILDQDIENAYEAYVNYWGEVPTVSAVVERLFKNYPEYEEYWDIDPMTSDKFYGSVKAGLKYLGLEVAEDFEEAQLNNQDLQYINSILNKSVRADDAKRLVFGYLANTYGTSEAAGNLGAEAMNFINTRFKEEQLSADPEANARKGRETIIKHKLNIEDKDIDFSKFDDDTIAALASGSPEDADVNEDAATEEVAEDLSEELNLEDPDALKDMSEEDLTQVMGLVGQAEDSQDKQEESLKVDKDGNLMQESVNNVLKYYNSRGASDIDLAIALKEHCGLTKDEAREVIQNRFFEAVECYSDANFDKLIEFAENINSQSKLTEASIHDAFEPCEPEPTAITCGPAAVTPAKETDEPKDLNADNPLSDIQGKKIKEGQIAQELGGALRDVRAAKEANQDYDTNKTDKMLNKAEQSIELAKIDAVRQDV